MAKYLSERTKQKKLRTSFFCSSASVHVHCLIVGIGERARVKRKLLSTCKMLSLY